MDDSELRRMLLTHSLLASVQRDVCLLLSTLAGLVLSVVFGFNGPAWVFAVALALLVVSNWGSVWVMNVGWNALDTGDPFNLHIWERSGAYMTLGSLLFCVFGWLGVLVGM